MDSTDAKRNNELTEDYRRLTRKYKDLQSKFRHFEVSDSETYTEIWMMHQEHCKDMIDRLLKADNIISEQVLGWKWHPPDVAALSAVLSGRK
jgi:dynein regulatory complex protein 1